jgi:AraC family transcriptional regulator, arabinose operon regulatory protein
MAKSAAPGGATRHAFGRAALLPRELVIDALGRPVTKHLVVSGAGCYCDASGHYHERGQGVDESIVILCVGGTGWIEMEGVLTRVGAGTAVLIPAGLAHRYGSSESHPWTIWWCHVRGSDVDELFVASDATARNPAVSLRNPERAVSLLDELVTAMEHAPSRARVVSQTGIAWRLLTILATDRLIAERPDPLGRAMAYLSERLDRKVPVAELARLVGVSPSHLSALFFRATGGGVLAHHTELRMSRARKLLTSTSMTIKEIAGEVGYQDPFYFSRQFRALNGSSPTDYRSDP